MFVSQHNLSHLRTAQAALYDHYGTLYKEKMGQPPQLYTEATFHLDKDDVEDIQDSGKEGIVLLIDIPLTDNALKDKADIRLTKVRFFAPGAKTNSKRLEAKVTHSGKEIIANNRLKRFEFTHDPIKVIFRYNMETMKAEGNDTVDGNISWPAENNFASPGPFTQWKIEIQDTVNKNLDLSGVSSAYLKIEPPVRDCDVVITLA